MKIILPDGITRFVALDAHKHYAVIGAVNARQDIVLKPVRVDLPKLDGWIKAHLTREDAVVIESTSNAWHLHDLIAPHVAWVVIANPMLIKLIAQARVKTDARDTMHLARLLAAGLVPAVWVPPQTIRDLRGLIAHRDGLVTTRTRVRNRLHAVLQRHAIVQPEGDPFAGHNRAWWQALPVSSTEQLRIRHDLAALDHLRPLIAEADAALERYSTLPDWRDNVTRLIQLPGIGLISAMTVLAAIGDITRFDDDKHLVGYAGLGAGVHSSGQTHHTGRITKQGRRDLRHVLVEAAWTAVEVHPFWKQQFEQLSRHLHPNKAIVAIARKLLVAIWHVWHNAQTDKHADEALVARKLLTWAEKLDRDGRAGLSTGAFVRQRLITLGLGKSMSSVPRGPKRSVPLPDVIPAT